MSSSRLGRLMFPKRPQAFDSATWESFDSPRATSRPEASGVGKDVARIRCRRIKTLHRGRVYPKGTPMPTTKDAARNHQLNGPSANEYNIMRGQARHAQRGIVKAAAFPFEECARATAFAEGRQARMNQGPNPMGRSALHRFHRWCYKQIQIDGGAHSAISHVLTCIALALISKTRCITTEAFDPKERHAASLPKPLNKKLICEHAQTAGLLSPGKPRKAHRVKQFYTLRRLIDRFRKWKPPSREKSTLIVDIKRKVDMNSRRTISSKNTQLSSARRPLFARVVSLGCRTQQAKTKGTESRIANKQKNKGSRRLFESED